jgi:hypothetical protein
LKTLDLLDMGGASATTSLMLYFVLFCVLWGILRVYFTSIMILLCFAGDSLVKCKPRGWGHVLLSCIWLLLLGYWTIIFTRFSRITTDATSELYRYVSIVCKST